MKVFLANLLVSKQRFVEFFEITLGQILLRAPFLFL